jgi:hypothetical protein
MTRLSEMEKERTIESLYIDAIANGGDEDFNKIVSELDECLPDNKKVLRYQFMDAVIRFAINKLAR